MKVLLVNPNLRDLIPPEERFLMPFFLPPLGLAYIASYLESHNYEVGIIDANVENLSDGQIIKRIKQFNPKIIGFSALFSALHCSNLAVKTKRLTPSVVTVIGGTTATFFPKETLENFPVFDFLIAGEGELSFFLLVEALKGGRDFEHIEGLVFRTEEKGIIVNPARKNYINLDFLPFPSRHLLPNHMYKFIRRKQTSIFCFRGCALNCAYCSFKMIFGDKLRRRNHNKVIDEIEDCYAKYGVGDFYFGDTVFTFDKDYTYQLCSQIINRKLNCKIKWRCNTKPEYIDILSLKLMKKAGCVCVNLNIDFDLKTKLNLKIIKDAFYNARNLGLMTYAFVNINTYNIEANFFFELRSLILTIKPHYLKVSPIFIHPFSVMYYDLLRDNKLVALNPRFFLEGKNIGFMNQNMDIIKTSINRCHNLFYGQFPSLTAFIRFILNRKNVEIKDDFMKKLYK